jgi:hypothetical protein
MLTGRPPFDGEECRSTLAAIMKSEPDFNALPPDLPSPVRVCLRRCLQADATVCRTRCRTSSIGSHDRRILPTAGKRFQEAHLRRRELWARNDLLEGNS